MKTETKSKQFRELGVDIIFTFEYEDSVPEYISKLMEEYCFNGQIIYQQPVQLLTKGYRSSKNLPEEWMINGVYSCEKHILSQIIPDIGLQELKPYIVKISLWFFESTPKLSVKLHKDKPITREEIEKNSLSIYKSFNELSVDEKFKYCCENRETEDEFSFIKRSESKYYFQPDQRNVFTDDIVETFGNSKNVLPLIKSIPDLSDSYFKDVNSRRILSEVYFGFKNTSSKNLQKSMKTGVRQVP